MRVLLSSCSAKGPLRSGWYLPSLACPRPRYRCTLLIITAAPCRYGRPQHSGCCTARPGVTSQRLTGPRAEYSGARPGSRALFLSRVSGSGSRAWGLSKAGGPSGLEHDGKPDPGPSRGLFPSSGDESVRLGWILAIFRHHGPGSSCRGAFVSKARRSWVGSGGSSAFGIL